MSADKLVNFLEDEVVLVVFIGFVACAGVAFCISQLMQLWRWWRKRK